jgi:mannose-1-phosphate guanylyltransferase
LSRPELPKAFLEVVDGAGTGLSAAVRRAGLVRGAGVPATISHTRHAAKIAAEEGIGTVLLEPESRGTAAAVAAGAAWLAGVASPETILVVLPSDHHVVDEAALAAVIARAADLARNGALVVLGARAEGPETAYGYILPSNLRDGVADLGAFVEKPSQSRAETLVAAGGLWNCGVFVGAASVILEELRRWAPAVASAAEAGVREARTTNAGFEIGPGFDKAPIAAFDTAVMEKTERGRVVTVDCGWSDLGARPKRSGASCGGRKPACHRRIGRCNRGRARRRVGHRPRPDASRPRRCAVGAVRRTAGGGARAGGLVPDRSAAVVEYGGIRRGSW